MASSDGCSSLGFWLLQPELMTVKELKELLISRCVASETVRGMDKDMLVGLYKRVVLPLPQREDSRCRSKIHSTKRQTISAPGMSSKGCSFTIGFNGDITSRSGSGKRSGLKVTGEERLKPPPEVGDRSKKIKLNKSDSSLDSIIIINKRRNSQSSEEKSSDSLSSGKMVVDLTKTDREKDQVNGSEPPKKVTLKRTFSQQSSTTKTSKSEDATSDKKRRAKITWP